MISPNATIPQPVFLSYLWWSHRLLRASQVHQLGSRLPLGPPAPRRLSSDAEGSANNMTGIDLLGLSHEEVNATDAWWRVRGSEG